MLVLLLCTAALTACGQSGTPTVNDTGAAGKGSAIFLHCLGDRKPRTGGCVAIPEEQMYYVMQHVNPDCVVVINSMEKLGAEF